MIDRTALEIERLHADHEYEHGQRYARRNRLRYIDDLLNKFELLNLADVTEVPRTLTATVYGLVFHDEHPVLRRPVTDVPVAGWMDVLYELQDPLLLQVDVTIESDVD